MQTVSETCVQCVRHSDPRHTEGGVSIRRCSYQWSAVIVSATPARLPPAACRGSEMSDLWFLKKKMKMVEKWWQKRRNECCEELNRDKFIQLGRFSSSENISLNAVETQQAASTTSKNLSVSLTKLTVVGCLTIVTTPPLLYSSNELVSSMLNEYLPAKCTDRLQANSRFKYKYLWCKHKYKYLISVLKYSSITSTNTKYNKSVNLCSLY